MKKKSPHDDSLRFRSSGCEGGPQRALPLRSRGRPVWIRSFLRFPQRDGRLQVRKFCSGFGERRPIHCQGCSHHILFFLHCSFRTIYKRNCIVSVQGHGGVEEQRQRSELSSATKSRTKLLCTNDYYFVPY